jgi:hypothetical protein
MINIDRYQGDPPGSSPDRELGTDLYFSLQHAARNAQSGANRTVDGVGQNSVPDSLKSPFGESLQIHSAALLAASISAANLQHRHKCFSGLVHPSKMRLIPLLWYLLRAAGALVGVHWSQGQ